MPENISPDQVEAIRQYWNDFNPYSLSDPVYKEIYSKNHQEFNRMAVRSLAILNGLSEKEFRENILGERESGRQAFHSIWGGEVAKLIFEMCEKALQDSIAPVRDAITQRLCVEFQYCTKRQAGDFEREGFNIAIGIADALASIATHIPLPITTLSVYLVKTQLLDRWCDCEKKAKPKGDGS